MSVNARFAPRLGVLGSSPPRRCSIIAGSRLSIFAREPDNTGSLGALVEGDPIDDPAASGSSGKWFLHFGGNGSAEVGGCLPDARDSAGRTSVFAVRRNAPATRSNGVYMARAFLAPSDRPTFELFSFSIPLPVSLPHADPDPATDGRCLALPVTSSAGPRTASAASCSHSQKQPPFLDACSAMARRNGAAFSKSARSALSPSPTA